MDDEDGPAGRLARGLPLREALDTTAPAAWLALDTEVRRLAFRSASPVPARRRIGDVADGPLSVSDESLIALALCHPDGRVRQAALARAAGAPALWPLLVIRCSDWVGPVRERAREVLADAGGSRLAPLAGLVLLLARRERGGFARDVLERVLREGPPADVVALLTSRDRAVRRFAYRVAVDRHLLTPVELARTAANATDDVRLQVLLAEAALARSGECRLREEDVLAHLLAARSPQVRSVGVTGLRRTGRHGEAVPFLCDRSALVRACARYVVRQAGTDPLPLYRSLCTAPAKHPAAAAGLGECGTRADAGILWALTGHPLAAVRAQAVSGLRALDAVRSDRVEPLLDDPAPAVVRAAAHALRPHAAGLDRDRLRARLAPDRLRATRAAARRLLAQQDLAGARGLPGW